MTARTGGKGELRSSARTNLLMGTASNRTDVKQAAARAELALERLAEPLAALVPPGDGRPLALLALAAPLSARARLAPAPLVVWGVWGVSQQPPTPRSAPAPDGGGAPAVLHR